MTPISQMGSATFFPTSCVSLPPLSIIDGFIGVLLGFVTVETSVKGFCVAFVDGPVLFPIIYIF